MVKFFFNDRLVELDLPAGRMALDVIRQDLSSVGTKEGCREGDCGACAVLVGSLEDDGGVRYLSANSCLLPLLDVAGQHLVTIEGLNPPAGGLSLIQEVFAEEFAAHCGFCTPGFIVSLTAFLLNATKLDEAEATQFIAGNICRCTGYASIRRAARRLLAALPAEGFERSAGAGRVAWLVKQRVLPEHFLSAAEKLSAIGQATPAAQAVSRSGRRKFIAGGTDLGVQTSAGLEEDDLISLTHRPGMTVIETIGSEIRIGGAVSFESLRQSPILQSALPGLAEHLQLVASLPIRNRATIGGNLANASPIADSAIIFLALGAVLELTDGDSGTKRELALKDLFLGYKKLAKSADEIIMAVRFGIPAPDARFNFEKVAKRQHLDIASVNSALLVRADGGTIREATLTAGGVAPIPLFLAKTSEFLKGKKVGSETVRAAQRLAAGEIAPISDVRGSADYKRHLLQKLILAHFVKLFPEVRWTAADTD